MAEKTTGRKKVFPISGDDLEGAYYEYLDNCDGSDRAPSLPDLLGYVNRKYRCRLTEESIKSMLTEYRGDTHSDVVDVLRSVLMGLRGEYLSNPKWAGAMSTKAVLALAKDYGDGIVYSSKDNQRQQVDTLKIKFGDSDDESRNYAG